jgi:hypothetical protein
MNAHPSIDDERLCEHLRARFADAMSATHRSAPLARWDAHGARLVETLRTLYGDAPGFDAVLQRVIDGMAGCANARSDALRATQRASATPPGSSART